MIYSIQKHEDKLFKQLKDSMNKSLGLQEINTMDKWQYQIGLFVARKILDFLKIEKLVDH